MSTITERKDKTGTRWLTKDEVCEYLGVTRGSVDNYVARGDLPKYSLAGGPYVRFRFEDVEALLVPVDHPAAAERADEEGDDAWDF